MEFLISITLNTRLTTLSLSNASIIVPEYWFIVYIN